MTINVEIPVEEFKKDILVKFVNSNGSRFFCRMYEEEGQTLITNYEQIKKSYKLKLNSDAFSLTRKVNDEIRFRIDSEGEIIDSSQMSIIKSSNSYKIAIVLESPHRSEYNFSYKYYAKRPANGKTGQNIEKSLSEVMFWAKIFKDIILDINSYEIDKPIKRFFKSLGTSLKQDFKSVVKALMKLKEINEENLEKFFSVIGYKFDEEKEAEFRKYIIKSLNVECIDIIVINRVCYQTSLGSYYDGELNSVIRNNVFKTLWKEPAFIEDFNKILISWKPDIIINSSTKIIDKVLKSDFSEELKELIENFNCEKKALLFKSNHPGIESITESLEKID
ncbi:hypothetical protein U2I53_05560 [Lysinibacillus capsici]|uniref:hypothetical protein n=1 Tax=Lysinibacillus capsici TaxID=2115968 RepID=UPI0032E00E1A